MEQVEGVDIFFSIELLSRLYIISSWRLLTYTLFDDIFRTKRPLNEDMLGEGKFINVSVNADDMKVIEKDMKNKNKQIQFDIFNE